MKMKRIRHDVSYLVSAGLLVLGMVTATAGLVSDLWDLNDFVYHKYAAYTVAVLAMPHVYLHWGQLVAYARWRLGKRPGRRRRLVASPSATLRTGPSTLLRPRPELAEVTGPLDWFRQSTTDRENLTDTDKEGSQTRACPEPCPELVEGPRRRAAACPEHSRKEGSSPALRVALRALLSRRGFVGLVLGSLGGFALGRGTSAGLSTGLRPQPALPYGADVGTIYHEWSKPRLLSLLGTVANWGRQPALYKEYAWAEQIPLPSPDDFRGLYTEDAIQRRRSVRDYSGQPMAREELSRLLYYTGGIDAKRWGHSLRSAPSAGALYPIEVYLVVHRVESLKPGLYHYAVRNHTLELLRAGDLRGEIVRHGLMQEFLGQANLVLVFTAIFQRLRWKYQERTYRYALLEAGHLGQNVYLAATSMGMGAFLDDDLNAMLEVDGQHEAAICMLSVGKV